MPYFLIFFILEAIVTYQIGSKIGFINTIIEMVISAFLGIFILLNLKDVFAQSAASMQMGNINIASFATLNFAALFGAILITIPGFLSDMFGFLFLSIFLFLTIINYFKRKSTKQENQNYGSYKKGEDDVIDAEIVEIIDSGTTISK